MIDLHELRKTYDGRIVVDGVSLSIPQASFTVLVGPSGCGKSTTLRMINGLITPDSGRVEIGGRDIADLDEQTLRRGIGYAIQAVGLFPHWTVAQNIATVPRLLGWPEAKIAARVDELLHLLDLPPERYAHARPSVLSGGQQQRVGVARALAADPPLLLMDEPFGALDPLTRRDLQAALKRIAQATGKTVVFVTHDIDEALLLADRIVIMERGRLAQAGTPIEILQRPASTFIADFVGGESHQLRLLSVRRVRELCHPGEAVNAPRISPDATLREALSSMLAAHVQHLAVCEPGGAAQGRIDLADIVT